MLAGLAAFGLARLALRHFDAAYGLAAAVYLAATLALGNSRQGTAYIVLLLLAVGAKAAIDRPRQRRLRREPPAADE